jgi:hypothetical protein
VELVRKQTYITREQDRDLKRLAAEERSTEAEVMRQALDSWLLRHGHGGRAASEDPFEALIGWFDGPEEVDHDDIYR